MSSSPNPGKSHLCSQFSSTWNSPAVNRYAAQKSEFANLPSQSPFGSSPAAEAPLSSSYSHEYSSTDQSGSNYAPVPFSSSLNESSPTGVTEHNAPVKVNKYGDAWEE
ncbi:hypothetical protein UY3_17769 [Chelonia mydas]|uniref:Uncharacterized protein n=1 Tax=Chelonia mydas TaxID=8469 RepID=M7AZ50_CHEMY|nr:hypothetical protein UY3_17769 [Chelonia mydas]